MPNTMQELGAQIGGLFFNPNKGVAYRDQMDKNARSRALMADARSKQAQALMDELKSEHYQKIPSMAAEFGSPNLASLVTAGGGNAQQLMAAYAAAQDQLRAQQAQKALATTLGEGNAALAALDAKPLKVADVDSNVMLNPYAPLGEQAPVVSPAFTASLGQKEADSKRRASTSRANTASRNATSRANTDARIAAGGKGGKPTGGKSDGKKPSAPQVGEVRNGYRYRGGDPGQKSSWTKA